MYMDRQSYYQSMQFKKKVRDKQKVQPQTPYNQHCMTVVTLQELDPSICCDGTTPSPPVNHSSQVKFLCITQGFVKGLSSLIVRHHCSLLEILKNNSFRKWGKQKMAFSQKNAKNWNKETIAKHQEHKREDNSLKRLNQVLFSSE